MFYYELNNKVLISEEKYNGLSIISEQEAALNKGSLFILNSINPAKSRRRFSVSDPSLAFIKSEGLDLLREKRDYPATLPGWVGEKINLRDITSINTSYPDWIDCLNYSMPKKWRINVIGLGDVGGTLCAGLRLLGGEYISNIGLYDIDKNKVARWTNEIGQILSATTINIYPDVSAITEEQLFDCDMFVFCVSVGVPSLNSEVKDVRMAQFEGNSRVIRKYARMSRDNKFKGIFAVVSDPVDLLCKVVFEESNTSEDGTMDFKGMPSDQIRGYGLGVMNGRAAFYASKDPKTSHYPMEGRVFGPHGQGLIVADSIENYNEEISLYLTQKTQNANMDVRAAGFKPYVAPALSSGSLSLIDTIRGSWHYSATFMGGVFMGAMNRLNKSGVEIETRDIPKPLWKRLENTYESLVTAQ